MSEADALKDWNDRGIQRREGEGMTEFTIRRIRAEIIEECAKFVEQHQERVTETSDGSMRSLSPRMVGNQMGLAYVAGLRGLVSSQKDSGNAS